VAGPINAGTFGPNELDLTFGPEIRYQSVAAGMKQNRPPSEGMQYFGMVKIDGVTEAMTVSLHDLKGDTLFRVSLDPEGV
jgi:alkaline phosphatase D